MMPYADPLRDVADWFRQLWAESLGKQTICKGEKIIVGPTPVKSLGATDQHSQVQLYMEGPFDKTITFLTRSASRRRTSGIPSLYPDVRSSAISAATPSASSCASRRKPRRPL